MCRFDVWRNRLHKRRMWKKKKYASKQTLIMLVFYVRQKPPGQEPIIFARSVMKSACRNLRRILSTIHTLRSGCMRMIAHVCFIPPGEHELGKPRLQKPR